MMPCFNTGRSVAVASGAGDVAVASGAGGDAVVQRARLSKMLR